MNSAFRLLRAIFGVIRSLVLAGTISVLMFASAWLGWGLHAARPAPVTDYPLPTIEQIQERIGAKPDGKLGSETQRKWECALCDQFAAESFRKAMPQRAQNTQR